MGKIPKEKKFSKEQLLRKVKTYRFLLSIVFGVKNIQRKRVGKEIFLNTDRGKVRVLAYNLDNPNRLPLFVDIHGSGFTMGHAEMDDPYMKNVAEKANVKVLSVDYSLSPDEVFPKALHECYDVVKYAKEHASEFGIDPENIAVGGHSAGGNLTAAMCLMDAEKKNLGIKCVILDYPPLDIATDPYLKPQPKKALPPSMCRMFNAAYCSKEEAKNPLVSPIFATVEQLKFFPPTLIISASQDSLCKEVEDFRDKLEMAGVKVTHKRFEAPHGFTLGNSSEAKEAWQIMIEHLKNYLIRK
jgi:acetyl esterase